MSANRIRPVEQIILALYDKPVLLFREGLFC
jgi:hypothetical protein